MATDITYEIPIESEVPAFKHRVDLDDRTYVLNYYFNTRSAMWHMDVMDADENPLLMGRAMTVDCDLLFQYEDPNLPQAMLVLFDQTEKHEECGLDDLGNRCRLLYMTTIEE